MRFQGERSFSSRRPMRKRGGRGGGLMLPPQSNSRGGMGYAPPFRGGGGGGGGGRGTFRGGRGGFGGGGRGRGSFSEGPVSDYYGGYPYRGGRGGFVSRGPPRGRGSFGDDRGMFRGGRGSYRGGERGMFRGNPAPFGNRGSFPRGGRGSFRGDKGFMPVRGMFGRGGRPIRGPRSRATSLSSRSLKVSVNDDGASFAADFQESFPCYLSTLKHIVTNSSGVSDLGQLIIQCDSTEDSNAALEALQKIELDGNSHLTLRTVTPSRIDPLRKIAHISSSGEVDLENLKNICDAESAETMKRWNGRVVKNLYLLKYATPEDATSAQEKVFTFEEESIKLRNYKKKVDEGPMSPSDKKKINGASATEEGNEDVEMAEVDDTQEQEEIEGEHEEEIEGDEEEDEVEAE